MRFTYGKSQVYGWCVRDTVRGNEPAYDACHLYLEPVSVDDAGCIIYPSPVCLRNEYAAMQLCRKLNLAVEHCKEVTNNA